jgi:DNA-binding transcriptional LysR family regulator
MDRFDAMRAFARVVEAGSFTKAAQTLHMSKTTVTHSAAGIAPARQIAPSHRKLGVTPDGAVYYERVIRLLADMEDAENSLSSAAMTPRDGYGWMCPVRWPALFWCRRYRLSTPATLISSSTWV